MKFSGKNILILGSNVASSAIVNYLKRHGAIVHVTDYYPIDKSPAKKNADVQLNISTIDTANLLGYAKENNIDGIFAGISELNLLQAIRLSETIGLPFYCNETQWRMISNKEEFKLLCIRNGVSVTKTFYSGEPELVKKSILDAIEYPVIVKPIDATASIGISIVHTAENLNHAIDVASQNSNNGRIIIEEYVFGNEFTAHYVVHNGKARLVTIDNRYPIALHEGSVTTIPIGRVFPSFLISKYINEVDQNMIHLCKEVGIKYGALFVQGIYDSVHQTFRLFEAGLRPAAESVYNITSIINGQNFGKMIIDETILGKSDYDIHKEDPYLRNRTAGIISIAGKNGTIGKIVGVEKAFEQVSDIVSFEQRYSNGDYVPDGDTLRQIILRFLIITDSRESLARDVESLNKYVQIFDSNDNPMGIKLDPEKVCGL